MRLAGCLSFILLTYQSVRPVLFSILAVRLPACLQTDGRTTQFCQSPPHCSKLKPEVCSVLRLCGLTVLVDWLSQSRNCTISMVCDPASRPIFQKIALA
mmetsp:Transcript_37956/g.97967  ORF Transcript_37956/g.97967 Transcript_37956/m.97967 type:complete len:99 (-) Transcript_37956:26-322(-)